MFAGIGAALSGLSGPLRVLDADVRRSHNKVVFTPQVLPFTIKAEEQHFKASEPLSSPAPAESCLVGPSFFCAVATVQSGKYCVLLHLINHLIGL